ncbi:SusC/RagA family TonB-linked outer membrane protein [Chitinophaga lutea]
MFTLRSLRALLWVLLLLPAGAIAQQSDATLSGVVTSASGEQLPGVSIEVKSASGFRKGAASDVQGRFSIAGLPSGQPLTVTVSYIGFESQVINNKTLKAGSNELKFQLKDSNKNLNELVVVGYGTQKKVNLTGAVSQVDAKTLESRPVPNVTQAIQGAIPNLNITFTDGRPGSMGRFNVRGNNPINTSASPLVLIDGVPGSMNNINPRDVETITVLKDASASAIYGARAAFGVILVTTKSAKSGKMRVSYGNNFATSTPTVSTDFITDGYTSAMLNDQAFLRATGATYTRYTDKDYEELKKRQTDKSLPNYVIENRGNGDQYIYYGSVDWWSEMFRDYAPSSEHNLSITGGNEKVDFLLSGRMYEKKGVMRINQDKFKSYNVRAKLSAKVNDWLTLTNNMQFGASNYTYPGWGVNSNFVSVTVHALPSYLPRNPDGTATYRTELNNYTIGDGIYADLLHGKSKGLERTFELMNTVGATIKLHKNVNLIGNYTYTLNPARENDAPNMITYRRAEAPWSIKPGIIEKLGNDYLTEETFSDQYHVVNAYAEWNKQYGRHTLKAMAGYNQELKKFKRTYARRNGLLSESLNDLNLGSGEATVGGGASEWALLGFFGRVNYDYKGKYLFEANGRYDGSSRFPSDRRFGFFPSVSAGWRISEEPFFEPLRNIVSEAKFRGSYGSLGNQVVSSAYPYVPVLGRGTLDWIMDGKKTEYLSSPAPIAADLTWEKTNTSNIGADLAFFRNKLNLNFDYYVRDTRDMLTWGPNLPAVYGAGSPKQNTGSMRTKGFELAISYNNTFSVAGKPLNFTIGGNVGDYVSDITAFNNNDKRLNDFYVGQRYGDIWGYVTDGYFTSDAEATAWKIDQRLVGSNIVGATGEWNRLRAGDLKFKDLDSNGVINQGLNTLDNHGDLVKLGNSQPRYSFGINGGADWNGFDISFVLQGVGRRNWYPGANADKFWGPYSRPYYSFIPKDFEEKIWSPENPNAYFPLLRGYIALNNNNPLTNVNDKYLQDLAYVRLKNLTIGYSLPESMLRRAKISRLRVYVSGDNLVTLTKLETKYIDPEMAAAETNGRVYPFSKVFSAGLDLTF